MFNQKFDLPAGAEVDKITSEYKLDGKLIVSVPAASQKTEGKESSVSNKVNFWHVWKFPTVPNFSLKIFIKKKL